MNPLIESLNDWGVRFLQFAWPMLWQSTLLIALVFVIEFALRRKIRPAVRYALWLAVLIKLLLPPSLALPTSLAWWLRPGAVAPAGTPAPAFVVTTHVFAPTLPHYPAPILQPMPAPVHTPLSAGAWALIAWSCISLGLLGWLAVRWRRVTRKVQRVATTPSPASGIVLQELFDEAKRAAGVRRVVQLRLVEQPISPAVYGLFRPVILLPRSLVERIAPEQLRAVLLHELIHFRRGDVWVNFAQSLLQIVYWWHPLVWLANARIRCVREEAVDDAVMLALRGDAEHYAPALLEVAKLALNRPVATLGLVGILESRSALRHRVERLMNFTTPGRAGLSIVSVLGIAAFSALALPMGEAPPKSAPRSVQTGKVSPADSFDLQSGSTTYYSQSGITAARSNVLIKVGDTTITADSAVINQAAGTLLANGHVLLRRSDAAALRGDVLRYHFKSGEFQLRSEQDDDPSRSAPVITLSIAADGVYHLGTNTLNLAQVRVVLLAAKELANQSGQPFSLRIEAAETAQFTVLVQLLDLCKELGISLITARTFPEKSSGPDDLAAGAKPDQSTSAATRSTPQTNVSLASTPPIASPGDSLVRSPASVGGAIGTSATELHIRTWRVNPSTFFQRVQSFGALPIGVLPIDPVGISNSPVTVPRVSISEARGFDGNGLNLVTTTNSLNAFQAALLNFFLSVGVDLRPSTGKNIFYSDGSGTLMVNATAQDLDIIEAALQELNVPPRQINLKVKFVELDSANTGGLGLDWPLNGTNSQSFRTGSLPGGTNEAPSLLGILTVPQFRSVLKALEQRDGADAISESQVTTWSGRQAQIQVVDPTIVAYSKAAAAATAGNGSAGTNGTSRSSPSILTPRTAASPIPLGPTLDLIPTLAADGYTIQLTLVPTLVDLTGYDDPRPAVIQAGTNDPFGQPYVVALPLPHFRVRQLTANVTVWDGQTVVLGGVTSGNVFRSETNAPTEKNFLIFVTPTIIDPAGNRVHPEKN